MGTRSLLYAAFLGAVALLAYADNKKDKATKTSPGGTWRLKNITWSKHDGVHGTGIAVGRDGICVFLKKKPSGSTDKVKGQYDTPFVSVMTRASLAVACHQEPWYKGAITDAKGKYKMWGGQVLVGSGTSKAAHTVKPAARVYSVAVAAEDKLGLDWTGSGAPQAYVIDFEEGGVILEDENGDGVFDANGDPVWATPPTIAMRFTSAVTHVGGGVVQYTHTLENFSDIARDFTFPELTSTEHPTGWSGTVGAYGTVSMSLVDTPSEAVCEHNAMAQTFQDDEDAFEHTLTVRAYAPESRLSTTAEVALTGAFHDPGAGANRITFQVSEPVEGAVLYRVDAAGETELVGEIAAPLAAGPTYEILDATFEPGENAYSVMAGVGVNGHRSLEQEIVNQ